MTLALGPFDQSQKILQCTICYIARGLCQNFSPLGPKLWQEFGKFRLFWPLFYIGGNLSGRNDVVTTVNQYCPGDTVRFGQSSSFFANPVSFDAAQKLTGLSRNEPDCQKRTVSPGQY